MSNESAGDSMDFLKSMWNSMGFSLPGMVTPTVDTDEIGKRIADLKAVEGWLKTNLNMLQMTIQGLEMQRVALMTVQAMGQSMRAAMEPAGQEDEATIQAGNQQAGNEAAAVNPFAQTAMDTLMNPALWPWNFMQQPAAENAAAEAGGKEVEAAPPKKAKPAARKKTPKK